MIHIVHGENNSASRKYILGLKKNLNAEFKTEALISDTTFEELGMFCGSFDIFGNPPFVVLDITNLARMNLGGYLEVASKIPSEATLVIFSEKELSKTNSFIKSAGTLSARVVNNKIPNSPNVFKFIDYAFSKNRKNSYSELRKLMISGSEGFYIFSMLLYGLRNVSYAKFDSPDYAKIAPFVRGKARTQASIFSEEELLGLYRYFYYLDKGAKTGLIAPDMLAPLALEKMLKYNRS